VNAGNFKGSIVSVRFGPFVFHTDRRQLLRDGAEVHLTPKALDLLALLIQRAPAVVPKPEIHARLWRGTFVSDATLAGLVKEVRRALGDKRAGRLIRTAHRVGFAFAGSSESVAASPTEAVTHWLVVGTQRVQLHDGVNVIGRDPDAAVWLEVPGVSRRHAQIILENGAATLEDLGSKNGTLLRGRPVSSRVTVRDADRIQVGSEVLVFRVSTSGISTASEPFPPSSSEGL
jgi:DNA-binding winged helix-turn-helix (wHTH) protein